MFHLPAGNFFAVLGVILCVILVTRVDFGQSLILVATIALAFVNWAVVARTAAPSVRARAHRFFAKWSSRLSSEGHAAKVNFTAKRAQASECRSNKARRVLQRRVLRYSLAPSRRTPGDCAMPRAFEPRHANAQE